MNGKRDDLNKMKTEKYVEVYKGKVKEKIYLKKSRTSLTKKTWILQV